MTDPELSRSREDEIQATIFSFHLTVADAELLRVIIALARENLNDQERDQAGLIDDRLASFIEQLRRQAVDA